MHAIAHEAFEHIFASAGALVFVNAYAGAAAAPAPSHAFAEHTLACPLAPLYHTLGAHSCRKQRTKPGLLLSASTGRMPHLMGADKQRAPHNERTAASHTPQKPLRRGAVPCASGAHGTPIAIGLARTKGPLVSALRPDDFLGLFPLHPLTLARYRAAFPPSRAKAAPTAAARQLAL